MVGGLRAVGGGNGLILLGIGNERVNVGEAFVVGTDNDERGLGHMVADGGKVGRRVSAELLDDGRVEVRKVHEADGHAVGFGSGELGPADGAGTAVNVLDNDRLANVLLGVLRKDTRGNVGAVACLVGNDHGHGAVGRPAGGFFRRSFGRSFRLGFGRRLGLRGSRGLAAGAKREHHAKGKEQGKCFFHFFFPFFFMDSVSFPPKRCCNFTRIRPVLQD